MAVKVYSEPFTSDFSNTSALPIHYSGGFQKEGVMFEARDIRSAAFGAGILLSAFTLPLHASESSDEVPLQNEPQTTVVEKTEALDVSSNLPINSGTLEGLRAPAYDGPVAWGLRATPGEAARFAIGLGLVGGLVGAGLTMKLSKEQDATKGTIWSGAAVGAFALAGLGTAAVPIANVREISTTIASVEHADAPHMETHGSTKYSRTSGPYFGQMVTIPESTLLFSTNAEKAPLIAGQKINARIYYDSNNQIVSWFAESASR